MHSAAKRSWRVWRWYESRHEWARFRWSFETAKEAREFAKVRRKKYGETITVATHRPAPPWRGEWKLRLRTPLDNGHSLSTVGGLALPTLRGLLTPLYDSWNGMVPLGLGSGFRPQFYESAIIKPDGNVDVIARYETDLEARRGHAELTPIWRLRSRLHVVKGGTD